MVFRRVDATRARPPRGRRLHLTGLGVVAVLVLAGIGTPVSAAQDAAQAPTPGSGQAVFGGSYADLEPHQQALFVDFIGRYNEIMGTSLVAGDAYDDLPASTRTTFGAITDALHKSTLTDASGNSLGRAIDLVAGIERLNGAISGAGGDLQFRAYVKLTDNARQILDQSVEFSRKHDNTMFHKDYPLNYRQENGPPSVQFSMTADAGRADIDVDYRSSGIPQVLWDGHLSVGNSDVRAGDNYQRHVGRWDGMQNWWRNIFGVFTPKSEDGTAPGPPEPDSNLLTSVPPVPRIAAGADLSATVADFLSAWLVEGKSEEALAYISEVSYACVLEIHERPSGTDLASLRLLASMLQTAAAVGDIDEPASAVAPLPVSNIRMEQLRHENEGTFTLLRVPPDVASILPCTMPGQSVHRTVGGSAAHATSFRITTPSGQTSDLFFLWEKHGDYWKVVTFHLDVSFDAATTLQLTPPPTGAVADSLPAAPPNADFLSVVDGFLSAWFVERDYDRTGDFFSPRCYACVDLLHGDSEPVQSENEARRRMLEAFQQIAEAIDQPATIDTAIRGAQPWNPELYLMPHDRPDAFTVLAIPAHLAEALECTNRAVGMQPRDRAGAGEYGDYYGVVFKLAVAGEHAPTLALLWARERGEWRIISYDVIFD